MMIVENFPVISKKAEYEVPFVKDGVSGSVDAIDNDIVYEFKCVEHLTVEHKLQLIFYAWMTEGKYSYILVNVRTGQQLRLNVNLDVIDDICKMIVDYKKAEK